MKVKLNIPQEPLDVKAFIHGFKQDGEPNSEIRWDSLSVWYGNQLQKYLWKEWKDTLLPYGFTWQKFMKLLKHRTDQAILWSIDDISWSAFIKEIFKLLDNPIADRIVGNKK